MFFKSQEFVLAAECYMRIEQYDEASLMFEESHQYIKALECYEHKEDWEGLLACLSRSKNHMSNSTKETFINKYVPVALNSIFWMLNDSGIPEENKGKLIEDKYIKNKIEKIEEVENEDEFYDEDGDEVEIDEEEEIKLEIKESNG